MGKFWWIIFILLGVWQIVGALAEKASKKQQEQRLRELAAQRRRQQAARGGPGEPETPQHRSRPAADRAETLAARRKAQLEELRRRRAGQGPTTLRTPPQPAPARRAPIPRQPATYQPSTTSRPQPLPFPARRPAPPTEPPRRPPRRPAPEPATRQRRAAPPQPIEETARPLGETPAPAAAARPQYLPPLGAGRPLSPALLRSLMVYREVIDPPLALRDQQVWERI